MLMLASAAGSSLAYLQSLLQQGSATSGTATSNPLEEPLASLGGGGQGGQTAATAATTTIGATPSPASNVPPLSPDMMAALISFQSQPPTAPSSTSLSSQLFAKLDANGDGTISKTEFESAFGSNADTTKVDALFAKLDSNGDGSVSQTELDDSLKSHGHGHGRHHHVGTGGGGSAGTDPTASTDATGASTQSITNSDGSTTTTITYADGSKVSTTTAPASTSGSQTSSGNNGKNGNFLEQLIQIQAQSIAPTATPTPTA